MIEIFFKCTLLSDVVLNSKLATEGNMTTLDYIPGSNFLGIVAKELYEGLSATDAYFIFHSGDVSFGDAIISKSNEIFYHFPFDLMMEKGKEKIGAYNAYLQHLLSDLDDSKRPKKDDFNVQLKQKRGEYFSSSGELTKIQRTFSLKSAQDPKERKSKEGAMFGFESLKKSQEFIFSIRFENENFIQHVKNALIGKQRIGKSKTAEYGQIDIEVITTPQKINVFEDSLCTLVYAKSNLCFFDKEHGQPTFQPSAKQLGLTGKIDWKKSQIRTFSYSPWNGKRNTTDTQRNCIAAGSVFYIQGTNEAGEKTVGAYQAEGLGRIIINPEFLKGNRDNGISSFFMINEEAVKSQNVLTETDLTDNQTTVLGQFLRGKQDQKENELKLSKAIQDAFNKYSPRMKKVSSSQWGAIRSYAIRQTAIDELEENLFSEENGYLTHGVAYERIWSKRNKAALMDLIKVFELARESSDPTSFIAKFSAEMAKFTRKIKKEKEVEYAE